MASTSLRLVARCKPCSEEAAWRIDGTTIKRSGTEKNYTFDVLLDDSASHETLFRNSLRDLLPAVLQGYSLIVLAYGLPCSGKTYSVFGSTGQSRVNPEARGVIARFAEHLLQQLRGEDCEGSVSRITASFCHVFADGRVADLLDTKKRNLAIDSCRDAYCVQGATEQQITSTQEAVRLIERGLLMRNATGCVRQTAGERRFSIKQPASSSSPLQQYHTHSSHAVFQYRVEHRATPSATHVATSVITIIDLAGQAVEAHHRGEPVVDGGVRALHQSLGELEGGSLQTAQDTCACLSSPLTKLLYPGLFGNSLTVALFTLNLGSNSSSLTESCLALTKQLRHSSNISTACLLPADDTSLGHCLTERAKLREEVAKINGVASLTSWETVSSSAVRINGELFDQLDPSSMEAMKKLIALDTQLIPPLSPPIESGAQLREKPLLKGMVLPSPLSLPLIQQQMSLTFVKPLHTKTPTSPVSRLPPPLRPATSPREPLVSQPLQDSKPDSSSEDSTSEESEQEGFASLPPLKDIPHIRADSAKGKPQPSHTQLTDSEPKVVDTWEQEHGSQTAHEIKNNKTKRAAVKTHSVACSTEHTQAARVHLRDQNQVTGKDEQVTLVSTAQVVKEESSSSQHSSPVSARGARPLSTSTPKKKKKRQRRRGAILQEAMKRGQQPAQHISTLQAHPQPSSSSIPPPTLPGNIPKAHTCSSSSNSSLSSELHHEARDSFDPNLQMPHFPTAASGHYPHQQQRTLTVLPALPPVRGIVSYPFTHNLPSPHTTPLQPPSYPLTGMPLGYGQAEIDQPPCYHYPSNQQHVPRDVVLRPSEGEDDSNIAAREMEDSSQYLSKEEIHVAALEGVKSSRLRNLVLCHGVNHRDGGGRTPLMYAVLGNQPHMTQELLNMMADVNVHDNMQNTPLIWAAFLARSEVMKILLRHGADVQATDSEGRTAFHWAMKTPIIHCLKLLCKHLKMGVGNKLDNESLSPLHWAVMCEQPDHIRHFLSFPSVDVSVQDCKGRIPLVYAVLNFSPACIKAILDCREAAVNYRDSKGRTALHFACAEGSADCVRTLLSCKKCNINVADSRLATPLHWAAAANQPGIVQLLLRRGAERGATDEADMTPLDHAHQRGHAECVKILEEYGIRKAPSVWSIASQFSVPAPTPPLLDEHGHKPMKRPKRLQPLFGGLWTSLDRLPADGHSHPDGQEERSPQQEQREERTEEGYEQGIELSQRPRIWRWLLCGVCSRQQNRVVPSTS